MSEHTPYWKGVIRGYSTNGRDPWQVSVEMPEGPGIYDGTGPTVEFERGQVVHVLTDTGLAEVERAAAEKALNQAAENLRVNFSRGAAIAMHHECHKKQCRCGNPGNDEIVREVFEAAREAIRNQALTYRRNEGGAR
ncbi:hypothetical protein [Leucobacter luti]|uniref:Uncharacterized protein n=1 Tax=Leucobacter luti TaxID=340320 RepID=A0A4Q7U248_9MICO|nr:hypothetical protein [Leucobacter luti]RZT66760.1 hypothetical protein EV139_0887 [Leucobacter luti]